MCLSFQEFKEKPFGAVQRNVPKNSMVPFKKMLPFKEDTGVFQKEWFVPEDPLFSTGVFQLYNNEFFNVEESYRCDKGVFQRAAAQKRFFFCGCSEKRTTPMNSRTDGLSLLSLKNSFFFFFSRKGLPLRNTRFFRRRTRSTTKTALLFFSFLNNTYLVLRTKKTTFDREDKRRRLDTTTN